MVTARLKMVLTREEIARLRITESGDNQISVTVDVHGMKCSQARRFINNVINIARAPFHLIVIHGYNHGTAIKEMLANSFDNSHIAERHSDPYNQGRTHMLIAVT